MSAQLCANINLLFNLLCLLPFPAPPPCREAIAIASSNHQLTEAIGAPLRVSPWFAATLAISHSGRAAGATVPVVGPHGSALLRVRVLRLKGEHTNPHPMPRCMSCQS